MSRAIFAVNAHLRVKPEHREALWKVLSELQTNTHVHEKETMRQYVIGVDAKDPCVFHFHEAYTSKQGFEAHKQAAYSQTVLNFVQEHDPLVEPPVSNQYEIAVNDNDAPKSYIPPRNAYCLNVESVLKDDVVDDYCALMAQHQEHSRAEPGCLQFDWGRSIDNPNVIYIHEEYTDLEDGYLAHEATAHFKRFGEFNNSRDPYAQPQKVNFYTTTTAETSL